jgi:quercetin 2,3-dioxygenase
MLDPSIEVRRAGDRFVSRGPGLTSTHSFSFGEHYDPRNVRFGALLAHNEDVVSVDRGYDDHPHANIEIVTWVLSGALHHQDSYGNRGLVYPRLAQRMSAGSGIIHAERNDGFRRDPQLPAEPVHFVQMWLRPDEAGVPPAYAQAEISEEAIRHDWVPAISGSHPDRAIGLGTAGATLWVTTAAPGERRLLPEADLAHVFLARGELHMDTAGHLAAGDAVRVMGRPALTATARTNVELLVWTFRDLALPRSGVA